MSKENSKVDLNRVYSEEGIEKVFMLLGEVKVSDALIPTRQMFKYVKGSEVRREFVIDDDDHYEFYEVLVNRIIEDKMDLEMAKEYVKGVKKKLRMVQGKLWSSLFGYGRGMMVKRYGGVKRPLIVHEMVMRNRVPFEIVKGGVLDVKVVKDVRGVVKVVDEWDEGFVKMIKEKDKEFMESYGDGELQEVIVDG